MIISEKVEELLEGPLDPTWPLIIHVEDIIRRFIETKGRVVLSIDDVFLASSQTRREAQRKRQEAEERLTEGLLGYLDVAVPHMHAVSNAFASCFKPGPGEKPYDIHTFETQERQYRTLADHLGRMMKSSPYFSADTRREVRRVVDHFKDPSSGFSLKNRRVHLGFKHGSLALDQSPASPVALAIFRIKDEMRYSQQKLPCVIGSRIMDYFLVVDRLKRDAHPDLPKSAIETFGGMEYFELPTPFSEGPRYTKFPDPMEYLFIGTRVSDLVGVTFVARSRDEVFTLVNYLIYGNFLGSDKYTVLNGKNLRKRKNVWKFEDGPVIDDHSQGGDDNGDRPIFLYLLPKGKSPVRVDVGLIDVHCLAKDSPPNERAHSIYEQRQLQAVSQWPIPYQNLFASIADALEPITRPINVRRYPLYKESALIAAK